MHDCQPSLLRQILASEIPTFSLKTVILSIWIIACIIGAFESKIGVGLLLVTIPMVGPDRKKEKIMTECNDSDRDIRLIATEGSTVMVGHRDKAERIRESLLDLQLAIDGCIAQQTGQLSQSMLSQSIAALARSSSIFLRKTVIGDRGDRKTRLLDDDFCQIARLGFDKIRQVPRSRRTLHLIPVNTSGGHVELTKLDDENLVPEHVQRIPVGSQRLEFAIEWPLSGMVDWTDQPTDDSPWEIRTEGLFALTSTSKLSCDAWLGQQLVIFDNKGITLKDVIRVMVNTEGAHSPPVSRLFLEKDEKDDARPRVIKDRNIHILSHITICGVKYSHAIVIQTALYLYRELLRNSFVRHTEGEVTTPVFGFVPDDAFSSDQNWIKFDGGLATLLGGASQVISHRIKATG